MITNADMNKILADVNVILDKLDKRIKVLENKQSQAPAPKPSTAKTKKS